MSRNIDAQGGFSLIEITISMAVVAIGALMAMSLMVSSISLELDNRHTNAETADTRALIEEVEGMDFEEVWTRFNANPADDPDGAGTAQGQSHTRHHGDRIPGGASTHGAGCGDRSAQMTPGRRLSVRFTMPTDVNGLLSEQEAAAIFGTQIDINADGAIDGDDRAGDHKAVPMLIDVEVEGSKGRKKTIRIPRIRIQRRPDGN